MRKALAVSTVCVLVLFSGFNSTAQKNKPKVDLSQLRARLVNALGDHLAVVKDELNAGNSSQFAGSYWLVHVQPKRTGHFAIKYRYNYNGKLYSHVERELRIRIGRQGCLRQAQGSGYYAKFCMGDTIILPIALENFTEHEFSLKFTDEDIEDLSTEDARLNTSAQSENPVADHLRYIGTRSETQLHRAGGYTLERYAVFEAKEPGRFNLSLSSTPYTQARVQLAGTGFPIMVVARNAPITALLAREDVEGFSKGFNGQEYSSSSGSNTNYLTNLLILQTGDRFSFNYETETHSAAAERKERDAKAFENQVSKPPFIAKLPFSFDNKWGYNLWIKDWVFSGK